jgi:hypothetical protein
VRTLATVRKRRPSKPHRRVRVGYPTIVHAIGLRVASLVIFIILTTRCPWPWKVFPMVFTLFYALIAAVYVIAGLSIRPRQRRDRLRLSAAVEQGVGDHVPAHRTAR